MKQKYPLLHKTGEILLAAADRVMILAQKVEGLSGKASEILALLIYAAAHLYMALVHEPFFDEAESWQIARSATLKTLLLETTHYEGHPPLWHLILMPLAKAGAPYELSLTLVSLVFMGTAVFLILRYAPFPRLVRLLLPFTYFFFYQYGVISRVYCVMTLAFVLLAMAYRRRNERPGRYVAVLIIMCLTLAYGLVIAGGLAIVWLWEIRNEGRRKLLREWTTDRRIWWLALLLSAAVGVIWMIIPRADTYATVSVTPENIRNHFAVRLIYTFFVLPSDVTLTDIYCDHTLLSWAYLMPSAFFGGVLIGVLIWGLLLHYGRKRGTALLLVLPYSFFAVFTAAVYAAIHHIAIGLLYFCFWCWVTAESEESAALTDKKLPRRKKIPEDAVRCAAILLGTLAMVVSLCWTGAACQWDIDNDYAPGRNGAAFIKEHHLNRYRMMTAWLIRYDEDKNISMTDINQCYAAVCLAPYFEHNLFFNFNNGKDERNYVTQIHLSEEETQKQYELWNREEPPQVLWMLPDLEAVYGESVRLEDYALVYQEPYWQIWKAGANPFMSEIYVRRDLLEETGLR